jgi:hypothetical protein
MTPKVLTYLSLTILLSCSSRQPNNVDEKTKGISFGFPLTNPRLITSSSHSEVSLDSSSRKMWTDRIMGRSQYYNSTGLASFDKVNDFVIIAVETTADDWSKSFLLTLDNTRQMIDFIEITDNYGDATQDENGNETVVGTNMRTEFLNNSVFTRTRINETIYNYQQSNELTEKDSIVERFEIGDQGKFRKLSRDSVRTCEQTYER